MSDINLSSFDNNKSRIKDTVMNFIVPLIAVTLSGLMFFLVIYPSFTKTKELKSNLDSAKLLQTTLTDKIGKINKLVDFKPVVEENSALVNKVMPDEDDVPGILDQVDQITRDSGLNVTKLSYSFGDNSTLVGNTKDTAAYQTVFISLGAEGNYNQMIQFLKNIEMSARLVNVTNFRFNAAVDKNDQMLSLNFSLVAPYLKVQSTAVTDDALKLDLSNGDFVSFINKVKDFKYYKQLSADQQSDARKKAEEQKMEEVTEATPSAPSTAEPSPTSAQ